MRHTTTLRHLVHAQRHHQQAPTAKRAPPPVGDSESGQILWSLIDHRSVVPGVATCMYGTVRVCGTGILVVARAMQLVDSRTR